ncbi:hypothetical protein HGRIS_013484 [Hohenbuehelia grisea]|uniref:Uncharacterized protein n=1 Tax=Hohenbuehelia grisea TaxID=104357 RepID=A0ABR3IVU1_9AGAR
MISTRQAHFISYFAVSFLLGVFTLLFGILVCLFVSWPRTRGKRSYWGLGVATVLYLSCVAHFALAVRQDYPTFTGGDWTDIKKFALSGMTIISLDSVTCIIADILLVWRLWVVYNKDLRVAIVPALLVLGTAVTSIGYIGTGFRLIREIEVLTMQDVWRLAYTNPIRAWSVPRILLSTITNVVLTAVIANKFLRHHRAMRAVMGSTTLLFESIVIVESGAIYALAWIVRFVVYLFNDRSSIIVADTIGQLAGIVPTLIIVTIMAGFSPITRPDYSNHFPNNGRATTQCTSIVVDTRFSIATDSDVISVASIHDSKPADPNEGEIHESRADLQRHTESNLASRV